MITAKIDSLNHAIRNFNMLSQKNGRRTRLKFSIGDKGITDRSISGSLVMGTEEQFKHGEYQAMLMYAPVDSEDLFTVINCLTRYHCFEFGE